MSAGKSGDVHVLIAFLSNVLRQQLRRRVGGWAGSVSASCGQVSLRPSGNVQVVAKEKVDYFDSSGCGGLEKESFPFWRLKNKCPPSSPPAFHLGDFLFLVETVGLWQVP